MVIWKRIHYSMVVILSKVDIKNKQTKRLLELKWKTKQKATMLRVSLKVRHREK